MTMTKTKPINEIRPIQDCKPIKNIEIGVWSSAEDGQTRVVFNVVAHNGDEFIAMMTPEQARSFATNLIQTAEYAETGEDHLLQVN